MQVLHSYENKNILVTGGAGFIGHHLVNRLLKQGSNIFVVDNLSTGRCENLPAHPNLHFCNDSVLNTDWIKSFSKIRFDLIIHLASVVGMRLATKFHDRVYTTSTAGTLQVMKALPDVPVVLFSSSAVYGTDSMYPLRESENISYEELLKYDGGTKGYACGKWEMEQIGLQACRTYRKVMIVRPFNVVGDKQVSNYGMVVPSFIEQAMKSDLITIFGDGSQVRSFSCIETFSECFFKLLLQKEAWEYGNNIFNIGTQTGTSINDLALTVLKETNSKSLIKHVLYNEVFPNHTDVLYRVPDTRHGENYFGKVQWPSIQQIVCSIINNKIMLRT